MIREVNVFCFSTNKLYGKESLYYIITGWLDWSMKVFEDKHECTCGSCFIWRYVKLNAGEAFFSRMEERMLNFKNYHETEYQHIIEIECPYCDKRHFVEFDK